MARGAENKAQWAELGAQVRLTQLAQERRDILNSFPNLRVRDLAEWSRPKRRVSAKARQAMSAGMRRFWARRKATAKMTKASGTS